MKALLTAAITTLTVASPAAAWEFDTKHQALENTIEHLMVVTVDDPECFEDTYAGWISKSGIVICGVNSPDRADFQDTLRHEGVHLAQRCKAYVNGVTGYSVLSPTAEQAGRVRFAQVLQSYEPYQRGFEAEAWFIASLNSPDLVDQAIRTHCSFAF